METRTKSQAIFRPDRIHMIAYRTFTLPVAFENAAAWMRVFMRLEYMRMMLAHLGYPQYVCLQSVFMWPTRL
jgi:hypothetical protein